MIISHHDDWPELPIGPKAERLKELASMEGVRVPDFIVLCGDTIADGHFSAVTEAAANTLSGNRFVVRSAALQEDTARSALAGAFLTQLDVPLANLAAACQAVWSDAQGKGVDASDFSIIVQEYVAPDRAGTLFTRDPRGYRETRIEFVDGTSKSAVGGDAVQSVLVLGDTVKPAGLLPEASELAKLGHRLEAHFTRPQDVEWVIREGQVWVVQARDITTLTSARVRGLTFLDTQFQRGAPYYLEQAAIAESFARPTPLDVSLLRFLYKSAGPVARAYAAVGVQYQERPQFTLVGNQLYIDKHEETRTLFPAMGHRYRPGVQPHVEQLRGLRTTFRNMHRLTKSAVDIGSLDPKPIIERVCTPVRSATVSEALAQFAAWYPHVFRINLGSQLALARPNEKLSTTTAGFTLRPHEIAGELVGNSLAISDASTFQGEPLLFDPLVDMVHGGWLCYRELGRWLTVALVTDVRQAAERTMDDIAGLDESDVLFVTLEELQAGAVEPAVVQQRQREYEVGRQYDFPPRITSFPVTDTSGTIPVAPGVGRGTLCRVDTFAETVGPKVLLVDRLTPELAGHLDDTVGIISQQGGVLSHLAIMARERDVPVVVTTESWQEKLGAVVEVDGTNGDIRLWTGNSQPKSE